MKLPFCSILWVLLSGLFILPLEAQTLERKVLLWEQRKIDIGPVLEENGPVETTFYGLNMHTDSVFITEVITDCGCTAVDYSKDTLSTDKIAAIHVRFDPDHRGGDFSKAIIIKTNLDHEGDTLYLEGVNMPLPDNPELTYPYRKGTLGFRLPSIHMGNVLTNEPKTKFVEVFNFGPEAISLHVEALELPQHIYLVLLPDTLVPSQRALLQVVYDGEKKSDFGFFEENISLAFGGEEAESIDLKLSVVVFEYFDPVPKSMETLVPRIGISELEIDLKEISTDKKVSRSIHFDNLGGEDLVIRKISSNCDCLQLTASEMVLSPGQRGQINFEFDPKGRRGIDHKHITIFSNDPIHPVRTITIKSNIK
ncbi:MAG: DUF1573 domain-containing protein [Cecembia sp.]